jgi:predicted transcriptional regulator
LDTLSQETRLAKSTVQKSIELLVKQELIEKKKPQIKMPRKGRLANEYTLNFNAFFPVDN